MCMTHLIVLIILVHSSVTLIFSDNLPSVLDNDLMSIKAAVGSYTVTAILSLDNFHTNSILAASFPTLLQISKGAVSAFLTATCAVSVIALIKHYSVLTILVTAVLCIANAFG